MILDAVGALGAYSHQVDKANMASTTETKTTPICCRCGETCILGFEIRTYGPRDPETGDQDEEIVCCECLDEEANRGDWDEYDAADTRFTQLFEEGEL